MKDICTKNNREVRINNREAQWTDPNATALSIYRGVMYAKPTDEAGNQRQHSLNNPKNIRHRRCSTSKGDVIVSCLSEHMFTVKTL